MQFNYYGVLTNNTIFRISNILECSLCMCMRECGCSLELLLLFLFQFFVVEMFVVVVLQFVVVFVCVCVCVSLFILFGSLFYFVHDMHLMRVFTIMLLEIQYECYKKHETYTKCTETGDER